MATHGSRCRALSVETVLLAPRIGLPLLMSAAVAASLLRIDQRSNAEDRIASSANAMLADTYTSISDAFMCITIKISRGEAVGCSALLGAAQPMHLAPA